MCFAQGGVQVEMIFIVAMSFIIIIIYNISDIYIYIHIERERERDNLHPLPYLSVPPMTRLCILCKGTPLI